jgi:hypothetical protein
LKDFATLSCLFDLERATQMEFETKLTITTFCFKNRFPGQAPPGGRRGAPDAAHIQIFNVSLGCACKNMFTSETVFTSYVK